MTYVDGFVIPMKKENVGKYKKMAQWGSKMWKKHGALDYYECIGDDLRTKKGMGMGFGKLARLKKGETVVFSFIVYKSRKHRDEVNKAVMKEMSKNMTAKEMEKMGEIMDMKRFSTGGFQTIVEWK
jgi:alkaline phosphatase